MEYRRGEHRAHLVSYHLVWCLKRRRPVLTGAARDSERVIRGVRADRRWYVIRVAMHPDHVHLFVCACPSTPAAEIARWCMGRTSWSHPHVLRLPSLWTRSFFYLTAGNLGRQTDRYIAADRRR